MKKKIYLEDEAKARLRKMFGCTNALVWKALTFDSSSKLARKIRYVALTEMGGVPNWKATDIDTNHDQVEETVTQTFGERVKLVASMRDKSIMVYVDGELNRKANYEELSIPAFMALQQEVQRMAMSL